MKLKANELIKLLIEKENLTQKELVQILTDKIGKNIHLMGFPAKPIGERYPITKL